MHDDDYFRREWSKFRQRPEMRELNELGERLLWQQRWYREQVVGEIESALGPQPDREELLAGTKEP